MLTSTRKGDRHPICPEPNVEDRPRDAAPSPGSRRFACGHAGSATKRGGPDRGWPGCARGARLRPASLGKRTRPRVQRKPRLRPGPAGRAADTSPPGAGEEAAENGEARRAAPQLLHHQVPEPGGGRDTGSRTRDRSRSEDHRRRDGSVLSVTGDRSFDRLLRRCGGVIDQMVHACGRWPTAAIRWLAKSVAPVTSFAMAPRTRPLTLRLVIGISRSRNDGSRQISRLCR